MSKNLQDYLNEESQRTACMDFNLFKAHSPISIVYELEIRAMKSFIEDLERDSQQARESINKEKERRKDIAFSMDETVASLKDQHKKVEEELTEIKKELSSRWIGRKLCKLLSIKIS